MIKFISLISGSSGNSTLISDGQTHLLIDCGMSGKRLKEKLSCTGVDPQQLSGVLITHEHTDHTCGVGVIARRYGLPVFATEKTFGAMDIGAIDANQINIVVPDTDFVAGTIRVTPFSIPHDAADPVGYSFCISGEKYTVATDIGFMPDKLFSHLAGSDSIILESNHDIEMLRYGSYPYDLKRRILSNVGHMSNDLTAETSLRLADSGTKRIMLAHLSHENNTPDIARITTASMLDREGYSDVELYVADRYDVTAFAV